MADPAHARARAYGQSHYGAGCELQRREGRRADGGECGSFGCDDNNWGAWAPGPQEASADSATSESPQSIPWGMLGSVDEKCSTGRLADSLEPGCEPSSVTPEQTFHDPTPAQTPDIPAPGGWEGSFPGPLGDPRVTVQLLPHREV